MPKRVSMKGKGADIFFGEYATDEATSPAMPSSEEQPSTADEHATTQESERASEHASNSDRAVTSDDGTVAVPSPEEPKRTVRSPRRAPAALDPRPATSPDELQRILASELVAYRDGMVEQIRRTVKAPGREVSYIRLTPEEKAQLAKIVYGFRSRGKKTTENEINRIAVNFMILDYRANGEESLLAKVIGALLA